MNWNAIYAFVTSLLFDYQMDETLFQSYLDSSQADVEGMPGRPWMILRAVDSSQSCGPSTTFQTPFNLGSASFPFLKFYGLQPIVLTDVNNNPYVLREIPFAQRFAYKSSGGVFCVDYVNKKLYIMGTLTQTYTINQNYIYRSPRLVKDSATLWVFDSYDGDASKALGFLIALMFKGIDYDIINLQNAAQLGQAAGKILNRLTAWDSDLQVNAQQGIDPFGTGAIDWQAGRLPGGTGPT